MKHYNLNIVNSNGKILTFSVGQPESDAEAYKILASFEPKIDAIVYFPISPEPCINPRWFNTIYAKSGIDFVFINYRGTIVQINHNLPAGSEKIYINPLAVCVLAFRAGVTAKHKIKTGNTVVHEMLKARTDLFVS